MALAEQEMEPVRLPNRALLGAAQRLTVTDRRMLQAVRNSRQEWQTEAWDVYEMGEVKYALNFKANIVSKVRLFAAIYVEPDEPPVPIGSDAAMKVPGMTAEIAQLVEAELERLKAETGGQPEIQRSMALNLDVAGDCYLVGLSEPDGSEDWQVRSIDEVKIGDGQASVTTKDAQQRELNDDDFWARIWRRHPRRFFFADSSVRGILDDCETILTGKRSIRASFKSRLSNGLLLVPEELSFGPTDPTTSEAGDGEGDPLDDDLIDVMMAPIGDEGSAAAVVPWLMRGRAEWLKEVRRVDLGRGLDKLDLNAMDRALRGLAMGLDVPPEIVTGMASVNHWSSWSIDYSNFANHVEPLVLLIIDSITSSYLRPGIMDSVPDDLLPRICVWYDPQPAITQPNRAQDAKDAHTAFAISDASLRRELSFSDDDAPDDEELQRRLTLHSGRLDPSIYGELLRDTIAPNIGVPAPSAGLEPGTGSPAEQEPAGGGLPLNPAPSTVGPPAAEPSMTSAARAGRNVAGLGQRLGDIDRTYRDSLSVALDGAVRRGLERAGSRLKAMNGPTKAAVRTVDNHLVASHLGPNLVASTGATPDQLLDGTVSGVRAKFDALTRKAQRRVRAEAKRMGADPDRLERLEAQQDESRGRSWDWLSGALLAEATTLLFNPHPDAPPQGEFDSDRIISGNLIREADLLAGGADLDGPDGRGFGGVGTGPDSLGTLADLDIGLDRYEWQWGGSERPFDPHLDRDGEQFDSLEDPGLAVSGEDGWLGVDFYFPGDHDGSLAAGTIVSGPVPRGASLRHWRGDLIDMAFASGEFLSATPNHPILTRRGWIAAGLLEEGDEVVRCVAAEGVAALVPGDQQVPSRIEDVVAAVAVLPGMVPRRVKVAAMNFHGDGEGSEVAVVWTDRLLGHGDDAALSEQSAESALGLAGAYAADLSGNGGLAEHLEGVGLTALGVVSGSGHSGPLLGSAALVDGELGSTVRTRLDSSSDESRSQRPTRDAETLGESVLGLAGLVEFDKVRNIERRNGFSGQVFDLQTDVRWYIANGVIVHNCLCDLTPVMVDLFGYEGETP